MANSSTTTTSASAARRKVAIANAKGADGGEIRLNGATTAADAQEETDKKLHDFFWTYTEEPHRTRRLAIIKAHPEVCHLYNPKLIESSNTLTTSRLARSRSFAAPSH